ncbi:hypothetical protein FNF27_03219 [Cafeteria roenbergensis]|uniref:MRH domain-containing protein n=1 Tax=Cafeteria roenbergensis TaxID=33653 RepID=A0A5A8CGZ9_CAFRO|nr:hypothetical protein FNF29_04313 [Cafeteria roenbergensis]KAA0169141.1 hypothetical protein FNF28_02267 [Cafeteria roenbergensis]KAA0175211.1 hypothetical protein FNF27_03219 [Cafeteria roenbergensis]|eukprot:KAA0151907.1 hypothetical protein FNF29_04313 [Cafeteria roenbergensis]
MRTAMALVAMAAASSSLLAQALTTSCSVEIRKGMSFDLTPLRRGEVTANGVYVADSSSMYAVNDTAGAGAGREYRYNFNFCGAVEPSQQCEGKNYLSPLPAFQTDIEDDGFCYSLSNQTKYGWQFASYDERFPSRGVTISYVGGSSDGCYDKNWNPVKRAINLKLRCSADADTHNIGDDELVVERESCTYDLYLESLYGCPTQCIKGNTLCNGQGVCGYDNDAQKARCFCNTGFEGDDCLTVTQPSSGMSIETVFLIIMVILLTVAMFAAGYMVYRLRRLTIDPAAYAELSHRFNELGMVTG